MPQLEDLERDEFVQSYLQYRWLDDTRTKFIDRYLVVVLAVFVARFQFPFVDAHRMWRLALYALFALVAIFMAKSIVSFRRQQRGHELYTNTLRQRILIARGEELGEFSDYLKYMAGKPVFLTSWVEFAVALTAASSPLIFLDVIFDPDGALPASAALIALSLVIVEMMLCIWFLIVPCWRYNRPHSPDWSRE